MPIRRWPGWCAVCRQCQKTVDLGDGIVSLKGREEVKESLDLTSFGSIEAAITEACGCQRTPHRCDCLDGLRGTLCTTYHGKEERDG
jgi:hypothetical protein